MPKNIKIVDKYLPGTHPDRNSIDLEDFQIAQVRRSFLFAHTTGLQLLRFAQSEVFFHDHIPASHYDHFSMWTNGRNLFGMVSTYSSESLTVSSIPCISIASQFAPYCGGWDPKPGASPKTQCLLFSQKSDAYLLRAVREKLRREATSVPSWNEVNYS